MTESVGWASLDIVPRMARGFEGRLSSALGPGLDRSGRAAGSRFGSSFARSFTTVAGAGIGLTAVKLVKDSVTLEASYSKTFRLIGVAGDVHGKRLQRLDDLAQQLGRDTIFSASDAADALLELVKNGIDPATIQAGALKSALTLATAGDFPLEDAARVMGNTLNAFSLKGKDAASVAAALAGAANASSADVSDLALALQQASSTANDAGLTVEETTGALAAFANAGIAGSDAGTSLKTMLSRLVPQTKKARDEMSLLGLDFTDAQGNILPLADIAGQLHDKLGDLSQEERFGALSTIFGSDARRAATILMREGKKGVEDYTKATSDRTQADKLADAAMQGTSGSIERLKGNFETAELALGKGLAPTVEDVTDGLGRMINSGNFEEWGGDIGRGLKNIREDYGPLAGQLKDLGEQLLPAIGGGLGDVRDALETAAPYATEIVRAFNNAPDWVKKGTVFAGLAALAGKKLDLFGKGGALGRLASGAPGSARNPLYVIQVGSKGGLPIPDKGSKVTSVSNTLGKAVLPIAAAAVALQLSHDFHEKALADGRPQRVATAFNSDQAKKRDLERFRDLYGYYPDPAGSGPKTTSQATGISQYLAGTEGGSLGGGKVSDYLKAIEGGSYRAHLDLDTKDANDRVDRLRARIEKPMHLSVVLGNISSAVDAAGNAVQEFLGGGGSTTGHGRRGAPLIHIDKMVAHDYADMQRQVHQRAQQANLGGRPAGVG
jgi:TP901 family phage tail tape measure protein